LRAKALVEKLPKSRRYRLQPQGYSTDRADSKLQQHKRTQLDRLYQKIVDDLDELLGALGLKAA
jgi:hypothetical protein